MSFLKKLFGTNENPSPEQLAAKAEQQRERDFNTLRDDGVRAMKMGEFPYAQKCFDAALEIHADDAVTLSYLAEVLFRLSQFERAESVLNGLAETEPDNANILVLLARSQGQQGNYAAMRSTLDRVPACNRENPGVLYYTAEADFHISEHLPAIAALTRAIEARPDFAEARLLRAKVLLAMGQAKEALDDTSALIHTEEPDEEALLLHATAQAGTEQMPEAIQTLQRLHTINPFNGEAIALLGTLLTRESRWDAALALYDEAIELQPDFAEAYKLRGAVKYHLHDEAGAAEDLKRSLELSPESAREVDGEYSTMENRLNDHFRSLNPYGF